MTDLITLEDLLDHVSREELAQVAGIGSHNAPEGRSLDEDKIGAAIHFASGMVKGYLVRRYPEIGTMAPADIPSLIKGYVSDVVRYRLRSRTGNRNTTSDEVENRFKDARDWMREVSRGLVNVEGLGGDDVAQTSTTNPAGTVRAHIPEARAPHILSGWRND